MLNFFFLFFFDVFVSGQSNTATGRVNQLSSSSLTRNAPIITSRPQSQPQYPPQYPPHSIQYSSSPNAEFVGGSVYSDGSGIHVHHQPYPGNTQNPSYTDQSIVYQPGHFHSDLQWAEEDPYKYFSPFPSNEPRYPSYEPKYPSYEPNYPFFEPNYPSYPSNYPSYEPNYPSYEFTGINTPTDFLDLGTGGFIDIEMGTKKTEGGIFNLPGVAPQNMIPGTQYYPSNILGMGLGRVIPVSDPYEPDLMQPMQPMPPPMQESGLGRVITPAKDRTDALLMFTLGRALGQLDKNNNQSTASIVEKFLEMSKPKVPSPPRSPHSHMMWGTAPWEQPQPISQPQPVWGQWDNWAQPEWVPPQISPEWVPPQTEWIPYSEPQWRGQPPISPWNQWGQPQWHQDISMPHYHDNTVSNPWGQAYDPWWSLLFDKNEPKEKKEEKKPWWYELLKPKIDEES